MGAQSLFSIIEFRDGASQRKKRDCYQSQLGNALSEECKYKTSEMIRYSRTRPCVLIIVTLLIVSMQAVTRPRETHVHLLSESASQYSNDRDARTSFLQRQMR